MSSTSSDTAATPSAPGSDSSTISARAWIVQATSPAAMTVSAQRGSRRSRASVSRRAASARSTRRGPARTAVETGMACGAPPPVASTQTVPGAQSGSSVMGVMVPRARSARPRARISRAGPAAAAATWRRASGGAECAARGRLHCAWSAWRSAPARGSALCGGRAVGFMALGVLGEALALGVRHLADDQRPRVDLLLDAFELGLALLRLALALALGRHGYRPTRRGRRPCGMDRRRKSALSGDFALQGGLALLDALVAHGALLTDEAAVVEALAIVGELVVGQTALVHPRAGLVQLGLGALARGDLLGLLGARGAIGGLLAIGAGDLAALADELALARLGAHARHQEGDECQHDQDDDHDGDDGSGGHGPLSSRFAIGTTRRSRRETVDP